MNKINTPRLLILLVLLVAAFIAAKYTSNKDRSKSMRSELVSFEIDKVTEAIIQAPDGELILRKTDSDWTVTEDGVSRKAVKLTVEAMFNTLKTIKPGRLVARSENKWGDYSVDSTGTRVQLKAGNKNLLDITLGRFGVEGQRSFHTFVRLTDEDDVYTANDFMKMSVYENSEDYRNSQVITINKDSLESIAFNYPDSSFTLSKMAGKWYVDEVQADSVKTAEYLRNLSFVNSRNFTDDLFIGASHNVQFNFSNQSVVDAEATQTEGNWLIRTTENKDEQFMDMSVFEKIFVGKKRFMSEE